MGAKVVKALQKIGYTNAGTVEFLMDEDGSIYFIEMNTRIQVEHPVTELVTGVDLIKAQIRIAAGEKLDDAVGEIHFSGHAIECRINAEDPETFVPSAGRITTFQAPGGTGVRVDSAAYADAVIPPYYDSMIAKLIVKGRDRAEAIGRMKRALEMFVIEGIKTSIPLHRRILADPDFAAGRFDTHFIERLFADERHVGREFEQIREIDGESPCAAAAVRDTRRSVAAFRSNRIDQELAAMRARACFNTATRRRPSRELLHAFAGAVPDDSCSTAERFIVNDRADIARAGGCRAACTWDRMI